jgi:hypothetical protein
MIFYVWYKVHVIKKQPLLKKKNQQTSMFDKEEEEISSAKWYMNWLYMSYPLHNKMLTL